MTIGEDGIASPMTVNVQSSTVRDGSLSSAGFDNAGGVLMVSELTVENEKLRAELSAFDDQFWEELEDLKHERQVLAERLARYEATGVPLP